MDHIRVLLRGQSLQVDRSGQECKPLMPVAREYCEVFCCAVGRGAAILARKLCHIWRSETFQRPTQRVRKPEVV